jgi:hypothetical protein
MQGTYSWGGRLTWCDISRDGVQAMLAKPDVKSDCDAPANQQRIDEMAGRTHRNHRCRMSGSESTQGSPRVQEEMIGTRKGTVRTTAAEINKPAKGEDKGNGYGEHRLWRDI